MKIRVISQTTADARAVCRGLPRTYNYYINYYYQNNVLSPDVAAVIVIYHYRYTFRV